MFRAKVASLLASDIRPVQQLARQHFYELSLVFSEAVTRRMFSAFYDGFFRGFAASCEAAQFEGGVTRAVRGVRRALRVRELLRGFFTDRRLF